MWCFITWCLTGLSIKEVAKQPGQPAIAQRSHSLKEKQTSNFHRLKWRDGKLNSHFLLSDDMLILYLIC